MRRLVVADDTIDDFRAAVGDKDSARETAPRLVFGNDAIPDCRAGAPTRDRPAAVACKRILDGQAIHDGGASFSVAKDKALGRKVPLTIDHTLLRSIRALQHDVPSEEIQIDVSRTGVHTVCDDHRVRARAGVDRRLNGALRSVGRGADELGTAPGVVPTSAVDVVRRLAERGRHECDHACAENGCNGRSGNHRRSPFDGRAGPGTCGLRARPTHIVTPQRSGCKEIFGRDSRYNAAHIPRPASHLPRQQRSAHRDDDDRSELLDRKKTQAPDIFLTCGKVGIRIWSPKIDRLTESDFVLAAKIDALSRA